VVFLRVVAFLPVDRARLVTFFAPALARVVAFLPVDRARLVTFFPFAVAFLAVVRALRTVFLALERGRDETFFPVALARVTAFLASAGAPSTISPTRSAVRSAGCRPLSRGGSVDGGAGGSGSRGISGGLSHGGVYPSLVGSSFSSM